MIDIEGELKTTWLIVVRCIALCCVVGSRRLLITILILSLCFASWGCSLFGGSSFLVLLLVATCGNWSGFGTAGKLISSLTRLVRAYFVWSLSSFASSRHRRLVVDGSDLHDLRRVCRTRRLDDCHKVCLIILYDKPFLRCDFFVLKMSHIRFCLFVHVASLAGAGVTLGMTPLPSLPVPVGTDHHNDDR
jgi:hypothetical protein